MSVFDTKTSSISNVQLPTKSSEFTFVGIYPDPDSDLAYRVAIDDTDIKQGTVEFRVSAGTAVEVTSGYLSPLLRGKLGVFLYTAE